MLTGADDNAHQAMTQAAISLISSAAADPSNAPHPLTIRGVRRSSPVDQSPRSASAASEHPIMMAAKGRVTRQVASKPAALAAAAEATIEATDMPEIALLPPEIALLPPEIALMRAACHPHASSDGQPAPQSAHMPTTARVPTIALIDLSGIQALSRRDGISSAVPSSTRVSPTPQGSGAAAALANRSVHTNRSAGALPQSARAVSGAGSCSAGVSSSLAAPLRAREAAPDTARVATPRRPVSARADSRPSSASPRGHRAY